jgi:branched-chain amino acid transport system substrate-binding protein
MNRSSATDGRGPARQLRSALGRAGIAGALVAGTMLAAWSSTSGAGSTHHEKLGSPVVIGASLSFSGDFSTSGKAFTRGYRLWAAYQNNHGGLLGHRIKLKFLSDASSPTQAASNYTTLITHDHVKLTIGPFSSLLTLASAKAARRQGYALIEGAGGAPSIFSQHLPNVFDVSYPVATGFKPVVQWIKSMSKATRPTTIAYATITTIFTSAAFPSARSALTKAGLKNVYTKVFPTETTDFTPIADAVAATNAQVALIGTVSATQVSAFMSAFETQHYNPKILVFAAGSDKGTTFLKAVGTKNALGVINPNGWYPGYLSKSSKAFVKAYLKKYGGRATDIASTAAEAYSVGQVLTQVVQAVHSFTNRKIINYLHSGKSFTSIQGPVKFNSVGENVAGLVFAFQWQTKNGKPTLVQILPKSAKGSVPAVFPKPTWAG